MTDQTDEPLDLIHTLRILMVQRGCRQVVIDESGFKVKMVRGKDVRDFYGSKIP